MALFLSLIQSCKARDINPWEYFDDMLRRIMRHLSASYGNSSREQWHPLHKVDASQGASPRV